MFRSSPSPSAGEMAAAADSSTRTWSISSRASTVSMSSSSSSSSGNGGAYDHQLQAMPGEEEEEEEVVGVAVGKEVKECKANLVWVLSNMDAILMTGSSSSKQQKKKATVVLLHVHRPAKTIPFMGANFPADQLHDSEVAAFRQAETEAMKRAMNKYRVMCARVKVQAVCKVETACDDVAQGILSLVAHNGITRLVVGAAADKRYTKKMMAPTSKTALSVQQQAPPRCTLWFLCKGNLICTRLATAPPIPVSRSMKSDEDPAPAPSAERKVQQPLGTFIKGLGGRDSTSYSFGSHGDELSSSGPAQAAAADREEEVTTMYKQQKQDIQSIFEEAEKLRRERHILPPYYHQVQVQVPPQAMVSNQVQAAGDYDDDHRKEQDQLELQLLSSKRVINDLQDKLSEAHCMLFSLERDQEDLRRQRDDAVREAAALRDKVRQLEDQLALARGFTELSYGDLRAATNNLDEALKLGGQGGGYGAVYKAVLPIHGGQGTQEVAIKVLNLDGHGHASRLNKIKQQVAVLRKLRHPNLVPLLGACLPDDEAASRQALVYEFLPAGNLDHRLPSLPWPDRTRIAAQTCSALVFLHRNDLVHGDLKPANVLLRLDDDDRLVAKLADYGLCRMLESHDAGAVLMRYATSLAYMDPEFLASGELRPSSDVYAFGVLLLWLLTGRPAMGLLKQVQAALPEGRLPEILDAAAGDWPPDQAEQLARLAVACCEIASANRPDLAGDMVAHTLGCFLHQ